MSIDWAVVRQIVGESMALQEEVDLLKAEQARMVAYHADRVVALKAEVKRLVDREEVDRICARHELDARALAGALYRMTDEVKRLEDLILQIDHDTYCDEGGYGPAHPEAQAIRARRKA